MGAVRMKLTYILPPLWVTNVSFSPFGISVNGFDAAGLRIVDDGVWYLEGDGGLRPGDIGSREAVAIVKIYKFVN